MISISSKHFTGLVLTEEFEMFRFMYSFAKESSVLPPILINKPVNANIAYEYRRNEVESRKASSIPVQVYPINTHHFPPTIRYKSVNPTWRQRNVPAAASSYCTSGNLSGRAKSIKWRNPTVCFSFFFFWLEDNVLILFRYFEKLFAPECLIIRISVSCGGWFGNLVIIGIVIDIRSSCWP